MDTIVTMPTITTTASPGNDVNQLSQDQLEQLKVTKTFPAERERRQGINRKYDELTSLIPNISKTDRASVVKATIDHIRELQKIITLLKLLVDKNKNQRDLKKPKKEDAAMETHVKNSCLQKKSPETLINIGVDVKVGLEVMKKNKLSCLMLALKGLMLLALLIFFWSKAMR